MYELRYMPHAKNYFKKLHDKGLANAYKDALTAVSADPFTAGEAKTGDLAGIYSRDVRYAKTNYELAYRIIEEDAQLVIVIMAGTRENFYHELKRYMY
ncbi:MAG: type II toxin-antitoxin system RelE/ParE family toxin [Clostridiales bacterium]|jgi:mRNA-degrading endonuclease RelE of RelBE toxin-antitoxin system|nr:type II toxin-antitoxin system RelE/ParE family toxin [Clostridiales bacterium]